MAHRLIPLLIWALQLSSWATNAEDPSCLVLGGDCQACLSSPNSCVFAVGRCHSSCQEEKGGATCYSELTFEGWTPAEICEISGEDSKHCSSQLSCETCVSSSKTDGSSCHWYEEASSCFGGGTGPYGPGATVCGARDDSSVATGTLTDSSTVINDGSPESSSETPAVIDTSPEGSSATPAVIDANLEKPVEAKEEPEDPTTTSAAEDPTTIDTEEPQSSLANNSNMSFEEGIPFMDHEGLLNATTMLNGTTDNILPYDYKYSNGDVMEQEWNFVFIFFAYLCSAVSAYSAVHLLDHGLWRSEDLKKTAIIKYPAMAAAFMLGFGSVWCMHYVGMAAVSIQGAPICYDWGITIGSLAAVVILMMAGIKVAMNDIFATPNRVKTLETILGHDLYYSDTDAVWAITKVVSFHKLHFIALGSFLAASGAIVMHYTGMMAQRGPFHKEWDIGLIAASCVAGIVICFAGFWIIFRLRWKIKQLWLRYLSAGVIALAVCGLHFFGMLSVTYIYDDNAQNQCSSTWEQSDASPSAWTTHQMIVVGIGIFVPALSLLVANIINQELILAYEVAARSNAIVTSLFPAQVRDRMFADDKKKLRTFLTRTNSNRSNKTNDSGIDMDEDDDGAFGSKPIADIYTNTTIMFADIAGFTAWSSEREPAQVFQLLETLYHSFDEISQRHGIFKVETVGDCYVAVCGLPDPRVDHAVIMGRVARDLVYKMSILTKRLEVKLGPDTGDLNIRIGLHSGSVTAGVLRGDRARFQLFGDTMNMASRMETTGLPGRIQVSSTTAELLRNAGKDKWLTARENTVFVKGKGTQSTYWLVVRGSGAGSVASSGEQSHTNMSSTGSDFYRLADDKTSRLIEWNVDILKHSLQQIIARRNARMGKSSSKKTHSSTKEESAPLMIDLSSVGETVLDEVCDIIELPEFEAHIARKQEDPATIEIPAEVMMQLRSYVTCLSDLYQSNPFHNFEHASHVTMSVSKLLSRIVAPTSELDVAGKCVASSLHDHTYGITSDPLTHFACILSALMHDVDHEGVPNTTLINENAAVAQMYRNKSVAEQNSVDLAWEALMNDNYKELRHTIYRTKAEKKRFRQLVVNSVMATDIMDKDLKADRNARWDAAFSNQNIKEDGNLTTNRKATIVIEHIIQASDVSHTMQHWHVFRKWNERLFEEMYKAYKEGRSEKDPSEFWYKGEIGFFDFYIIPLAKKLKDCGVFGVASEEYLDYAKQNREEWELRGQEIVAEMKKSVEGVWSTMEEIKEGFAESDCDSL